MISYNTVNVKMPAIRRRDTSAWVKAVAASYGKKVGEIAYIFVDDEEILRVNREYLQHDYYTDIITFDYTEGDTISGTFLIFTKGNIIKNAKLKLSYCQESNFLSSYLEYLYLISFVPFLQLIF